MEGIIDLWRAIPIFWRLAGPGLLLLLLFISFLQDHPDGRLHLHFLDAGQGNALLIETPSGRWVLIDGGPDATALLSGLGRRLPFWKRSLQWVVLTETEPDRLLGPALAMERYRAAAAGRPGRAPCGRVYQHWTAALDDQGVAPQALWRGEVLDLGEGVTLEVLHPPLELPPDLAPGTADDALVLRLHYGAFTALLPTAAGPAVQRLLVQSEPSLASTVLLVPRQAGEEALDPAFLQAVAPRFAVVSAGSGYREGPDARTLLLLEEADIPCYRTDRQGCIEVFSDGQVVRVRAEWEVGGEP